MFTVVIYFSLHRNSITFRNIYMTTSVFMLAIKAYLYFHPTLTTNYKNRMERRYIIKYILFIYHSRILHFDAFLNVNIKYTKIIFARWLRLIDLMMIFNHSFYFDGISIARLQITFICLFEHAKNQKSFFFS